MTEARYTAQSTADIEKLTDMIHTLLNAVWGSDWGVFSNEDPTDNDSMQAPMPHIVYNLVSRRITEDKQLKRKQAGTFPDEDHPGHNITKYSMMFDCELEFAIYAQSRIEATRTAQRFEEFMEDYKGYFKEQGISEILFLEESRPDVSTEYRQDIPHRIVTYLVRIERISIVRSVHLKEVIATINVDTQTTPHVPPKMEVEVKDFFLNMYNTYFPK